MRANYNSVVYLKNANFDSNNAGSTGAISVRRASELFALESIFQKNIVKDIGAIGVDQDCIASIFAC